MGNGEQEEKSGSADAALTWLCMAAYLCVGSIAALVPSLLPPVIREFRLTLAVAGRIFPAMAVGSLVGGLLAGVYSDRIGRRPFVVGSATLVAVWLLIASFAHNWLAFMGTFLLVGMAQGALSIGLNALVMDLNARRHGKAINTLHGMYSLGATVSPLLIGRVLGVAHNWRAPLLGAALAWLLLSGVTALFRYPASGTGSGTTPLRASALRLNFLSLGARSALLPLFALAFLYNGAAWSLLGWVKVFVQQQGVRSSLLSGGMISIFYAALTLGRFSCAHLSERLGYGKTLLLCAVGAFCSYPFVAFGGSPTWTAVGMFLSGLFLSGLYPTALAYASRRFPEIAGTVAGSMAAALTFGSMLPPWWTGVVAGAHGLPYAIKLNYALVVPLMGIALYLRRRE